jgi:hypothetical protein
VHWTYGAAEPKVGVIDGAGDETTPRLDPVHVLQDEIPV